MLAIHILSFSLVLYPSVSAAPLNNKRQLDVVFGIVSSARDTVTAWLTPPTLGQIEAKLGISSGFLFTEVFNVPGYANWTSTGWNLRVHGTASKPLELNSPIVDRLGAVLLPGYPENKWTPEMRNNFRNMTNSLLSRGQEGLHLTFDAKMDGMPIGPLVLPRPTDGRGEFDAWMNLQAPGLDPGPPPAEMKEIQLWTNGFRLGNATSFLVPERGTTVISDIDDVLRMTTIWIPTLGLVNTFGKTFIPWLNMPQVYHRTYEADPQTHFHYITTTPQPYLEFVLNNYPAGSFDLRPMNLTTWDQTFHNRRLNIMRTFETFPHRKFILVGDTTNADAVDAYAEAATLFPGQVQCILLRNVSATEVRMALPTNFALYKTLPDSQYQFFRTPDDLMNIDFAHGGCRNYTFPQNVTFGWNYPSSTALKQAVFDNASLMAVVMARWDRFWSS